MSNKIVYIKAATLHNSNECSMIVCCLQEMRGLITFILYIGGVGHGKNNNFKFES